MAGYSENKSGDLSALPGNTFDLFRQNFPDLTPDQLHDVRVDWGKKLTDGTFVEHPTTITVQGVDREVIVTTDTRTGEQFVILSVNLISPIFEEQEIN